MRAQAYRLFEIAAWLAAAWCAAELVLRAGTRTFEGAAMTAATGSLAVLTIAACRWRARSLEDAPERLR